jgi:hypothetical protein
MSPLRSDPKIHELARHFGLDWRGDCAKSLRDHALSRVRKWVEALPVESAGTLQQVVAGMVSLKVLFIQDTEDLSRYAVEYGEKWPTLNRQLRDEFINRDTMGLLLAHPAPKEGAHRNIAFIDSRGERFIRAYFTAWHEIAHLLLQPSQLSFSGFRRINLDIAAKKDPIEALVDQLAGELAFYEPLVKPDLDREIARVGSLTLDGIDRVRNVVAPEASFSATAHALVRMVDQPLTFVVAEMRLKPTEARTIGGDQLLLIEGAIPQEKLRVASAVPNALAKAAGFKIFQHMRVPEHSLIAEVYDESIFGTAARDENQGTWESGGRQLPQLRLQIEARKFGCVVYALISCGPSRWA